MRNGLAYVGAPPLDCVRHCWNDDIACAPDGITRFRNSLLDLLFRLDGHIRRPVDRLGARRRLAGLCPP
jgi:hypothetical protein